MFGQQTLVNINNWLTGQSVLVPSEWLDACMEFLQNDHSKDLQQFTFDMLKDLVYEQWLHSDLHELGCSCIPHELLNDTCKWTYRGVMCLQVVSVIDISQPFYAQIRKADGNENANVGISADPESNQPTFSSSGTRMLSFCLTDGQHEVKAMEYKAIRFTGKVILPGTKLRLRGPILCRRGIMMLSHENVEFLGGQVDSLCAEKSHRAMLASALERNTGVPAPAPFLVNAKNASYLQPRDINISTTVISTSAMATTTINNTPLPSIVSYSDNHFNNCNVKIINATSNSTVAKNALIQPYKASVGECRDYKPEAKPKIERDGVEKFDWDQKVDISNFKVKSEYSLPTGYSVGVGIPDTSGQIEKKDLMFDDMDFNSDTMSLFQMIDNYDDKSSLVNTIKTVDSVASSTTASLISNSITKVVPGKNVNVVRPNCEDLPPVFTYIIDVYRRIKDPHFSGSARFTLKAFLVTLLSKLEHNSGREWSLCCRLGDGSGTVDCKLSDGFLTSVIGFTAAECAKMRQRVSSGDSTTASDLKKSFVELQRKLIALCGLFQIYADNELDKPIIECFREVTEQDTVQMLKRITSKIT